jgi:uncharacterized protein
MRQTEMRDRNVSPPDELYTAIDQFNNREWFECHETLEDLWMGESGMLRDFYQGVIQIAIALHHWKRDNFEGAMKLLKTGAEFLAKVDPVFMNVDVAGLTADSKRFKQELEILGQDRMAEVDRNLIPRMRIAPLQ